MALGGAATFFVFNVTPRVAIRLLRPLDCPLFIRRACESVLVLCFTYQLAICNLYSYRSLTKRSSSNGPVS